METHPISSAAVSAITQLLDQFEEAWQGAAEPPRLAEFLSSHSGELGSDPAASRRWLVELIPVDLECRWRRFGRDGIASPSNPDDDLPGRATLRDYVTRFPALGPVEQLPTTLFVAEYRVRRQWGEWSGPEHWLAAYPALAAAHLVSVQQAEADLAREGSNSPTARPANSIASNQPTTSTHPDSSKLSSGEPPLAEVELVSSLHVGPGLKLGDYRLAERLGKGGMGEVFKAEHLLMQRVVAVKVLPADKVGTPDLVKRFQREVVAVSRLRHPNIVEAYDARQDRGIHFLVMEYVPGTDLYHLVRNQGRLPVGQAIALTRQAALGLAYAHEHGVVHRDLKPANLMLSETGTLKVLDLGLARVQSLVTDVDPQFTASGVVMGTIDYMAPEQAIDAHRADARADIYSLGCTLYFLLTAQRLYEGESHMERLMAHQNQPIPSLCAVRPDAPPELEAIYRKLVAKSPDERYQTMKEVLAALDAVFPAEPAETASPSSRAAKRTTVSSPSLHRRSPWLPLVLSGLGVLALVIGMFLFFGPQRQPEKPSENNSTQEVGSKAENANAAGDEPHWQGWPKDGPAPAIAPFKAEQAKQFQQAWAEHLGVPIEYTNTIGMKFALIPPGEFVMGSTPWEIANALPDDNWDKQWHAVIDSGAPQHRVVLTQPIFLGIHEVTQGNYTQVMGKNPAFFSPAGGGKEAILEKDTTNYPVEKVSWNDAADFCVKLSRLENLKPYYLREGAIVTPLVGNGYRLPTEAEWEYACRAGTTTGYWSGDDQKDLGPAGWYRDNSGYRSHPVGELRANPFGLFDMHGNAWEWVQDCWEPKYYEQYRNRFAVAPCGPPPNAFQRVLRGGGWAFTANQCRSSLRRAGFPADSNRDIGFRVSLTVDAVKHAMVSRGQYPTKSLSTEPFRPLPPLVTADGWLEVLPLIEPRFDTIRLVDWTGKSAWTRRDDGVALTANDNEAGKIGLPLECASADLEVELTFTKLEDGVNSRGNLHVDLPSPQGTVGVTLGLRGGKGHEVPFVFSKGRRTTVRARLTRINEQAHLVVFFDGEKRHDWHGPLGDLTCAFDASRLDSQTAGLCAFGSFVFHSILVKAHTGEVRLTRAVPPNTPLPAFASVAPLCGLVPAPQRVPGLGRWQVYMREPTTCSAMAWSPDGRWLACGDNTGLIRILDADNLQIANLFGGHTAGVMCLNWNTVSDGLASGSEDHTARIWNTTGAPSQVLRGHAAAVTAVAWSPNGERLASGSYHAKDYLRMWTADGKPAWDLKEDGPVVEPLIWSKDGKSLFAVLNKTGVRSFDAESGAPQPFPGFPGGAIAVSPQGDRLAVGRNAGSNKAEYIQLWDLASQKQVGKIGHDGLLNWVNDIAYSPDGKYLAVGSQDAHVRVWDVAKNAAVASFNLSPYGGGGGHVVRWDTTGRRLAFSIDVMWGLVWSPFDSASNRLNAVPIRDIRASPDWKSFVIVKEGKLRSCGPLGERLVNALSNWEHVEGVEVDSTPNSPLVAVWDEKHVGHLVDTNTGRVAAAFSGHTAIFRHAAWSPDGTLFASAGDDKTVRIWRPDGTNEKVLENQPDLNSGLAWSPDGKWLATAYWTQAKSVRLWSTRTWEPGPELVGHAKEVTQVGWLTNDRLLTASADGTVKTWELKEGKAECLKSEPATWFEPVPSEPTNPWLVRRYEQDAISLCRLDGRKSIELKYCPPGLDPRPVGISPDGREITIFYWPDQALRTWNTKSGELVRVVVLLPRDQAISFDVMGNVLSQTAEAEKEIVYAVEQPDGSLQLHTPAEFRKFSPAALRQTIKQDGILGKCSAKLDSSIAKLFEKSADVARFRSGKTGGFLDHLGSAVPGTEDNPAKITGPTCQWEWTKVKNDAGEGLVLRNVKTQMYLDIDEENSRPHMDRQQKSGKQQGEQVWLLGTQDGKLTLKNLHAATYLSANASGRLRLVNQIDDGCLWEWK